MEVLEKELNTAKVVNEGDCAEYDICKEDCFFEAIKRNLRLFE
ncbi:MAG: hypothetical protein ACFFD2_10470 [Promethearchaeota archaeon]